MHKISLFILFYLFLHGNAFADLWRAHIAPILQSNCVKCHGGAKKKADLDLRSLESILAGSENGPVIEKGAPEKSSIFTVLMAEADPHMPPKGQLDNNEIEYIRVWIEGLAKNQGDDAVSDSTIEIPKDLNASEAIDYVIKESCAKLGISLSPTVDDRTFCRRVHLDVVGRIPTSQEMENFLLSNNEDKRIKLIDRLLSSNEYSNYMAEIFSAMLLGRESERKKSRDERVKNGWLEYLRWAFRTNRPWDVMARDIVIAKPQSKNESGASWFLFEQKNNHSEMAKLTMSSFLGKQIQCAQCHDHPVSPEIEQKHYWGMIAFFNRSLNVETKDGIRVAERATGGFSKYADLSGKSYDTSLVLVDGTEIVDENDPSKKDNAELYVNAPAKSWFDKNKSEKKGYNLVKIDQSPEPKFSRREKLVEAIFKQAEGSFSKAFVNRVWALLMGRGFVHPVDKMDSSHPPSHPELLNFLASDFSKSGYDIKRLFRTILISKPYQLSSSSVEEIRPEPDTFSYFSVRALSAEALSKSLLVAMGNQPNEEGGFSEIDYDKLRDVVVKKFPKILPEIYSPSVQQALFFSNNPLVEEFLFSENNTTIADIQMEKTNTEKVIKAFNLIINRFPDQSEIDAGVKFLERGNDNVKQLCWALITGPEFRMNH